MKRFMSFMEEKFVPVASKIGAQRHLVAIRDSFMVMMPLMILGALAVMINNLPIPAFQNLMTGIFGSAANWKGFGGAVWNGTYAIISVGIAYLVAHNVAASYGKDGLSAGIISLGSFFALGALVGPKNVAGMGSAGLFVALIVAIISSELFRLLMGNKHLVIKMPDGVPPAVAKAFASLLPAMIIISLFGLVSAIFAAHGVTDIVGAFYKLVQKPFMGLANSYGTALLLAFIAPFLWFFGLHGANMIEPIMQAINAPAIEANMKAIEAGHHALYIVNKPFFDAFVNLGGTGATLGLIIAIYLVGRKSKSMMMITNLSAAPGLFNINEPVLFGLPVVLNPIMFIPFILTPLVLVTVAYWATACGLVPAATVMPPWVTPPIIGGVMATVSWQGGVLAAVNLALSVLIYMPFVRLAIREQQMEEKIEESREA